MSKYYLNEFNNEIFNSIYDKLSEIRDNLNNNSMKK